MLTSTFQQMSALAKNKSLMPAVPVEQISGRCHDLGMI
jgi:hypothetical protein